MTCIAGLVDKKNRRIFLGADSAATGDKEQCSIADHKIFFCGDQKQLLIGVAGCIRTINLLATNLIIAPHLQGGDYRYITVDVVKAMKGTLRGEVSPRDNHFLVAYRGKLYEIDEKWQIMRSRWGMHGIGSGGQFAVASLLSTAGEPSLRRMKLALRAASKLHTEVCPPFVIKSLEF